MTPSRRSDLRWYTAIGVVGVVVLAVALTVYFRQSSGPDTGSPRSTAEAFFAAWQDQDVDAGEDLVCPSMLEQVRDWPTASLTLTDHSITSIEADRDGLTYVMADIHYRGRTDHPDTRTRLALSPTEDSHHWRVCRREDVAY